MFEVSILVMVLVEFLGIRMVRFGVERELVGFCRLCCNFVYGF